MTPLLSFYSSSGVPIEHVPLRSAMRVTLKSTMVSIEPLRIEIEREDDGRILASVPDLPGVMAYADTEDAAVRKAKSIALQVLADMVESGDDVPEPLKALFAA
jgi:predicted RNase H-like HicB family nuclease